MSPSLRILILLCGLVLLIQIYRAGLHWLRVRRRREFDAQWQHHISRKTTQP